MDESHSVVQPDVIPFSPWASDENSSLHGHFNSQFQITPTNGMFSMGSTEEVAHDVLNATSDPSILETASYNPTTANFWEYQAALLVMGCAGIIIVIVGVVGNSLCILTLSQKSSSTNTYLVNLAIADLIVCIVGQMCRVLPRGLTGIDTVIYDPWLCKSWFFINHSAKTVSGWTLVAVTVERTLVVYHPLKAKTLCNVPKARIVITLIDILCSAIYLHYFWSYGPVFEVTEGVEVMTAGCTINTEDSGLLWYMNNVRPMQDFVVRSAAPFTCLLICNILIIGKLFREVNRRKVIARDKQANKMASLTSMLLTVSFAYLICISPMQIMYLIDKKDPFGIQIEYRWQAQMALRWAVAIDMYYANHAINFILYFVSGKQFRTSLKKVLAEKCPCYSPEDSVKSTNSSGPSILMQGSHISLVSSPCTLVSYTKT